MDEPTFREALTSAARCLQNSPAASRDAELLLMHAAGCDRVTLLTCPERRLTAAQSSLYTALVERRGGSEPVQYILGEQEFYGLAIEVTPDVLIPRPETEHLVEATLARLPRDQPRTIADVGTGSGAIAVALAVHLPQARIAALDISPAALDVARRNAERHHVADRLNFLESDLLGAVANVAAADGEFFDAIVSNPPYVAESESLEPQVRDYEPHRALFAGPTGLEIYQRLIPQAAKLLKPGGWLLLEIGAGQHPAIERLLSAWREVSFIPDLQSIPRVAIARKPDIGNW